MVNAHVMKRAQKADMILATCKKKYLDDSEENGVNIKMLISAACLEFGAGHRYMREILADLINTKKLILNNGEAFYIPEENET